MPYGGAAQWLTSKTQKPVVLFKSIDYLYLKKYTLLYHLDTLVHLQDPRMIKRSFVLIMS